MYVHVWKHRNPKRDGPESGYPTDAQRHRHLMQNIGCGGGMLSVNFVNVENRMLKGKFLVTDDPLKIDAANKVTEHECTSCVVWRY